MSETVSTGVHYAQRYHSSIHELTESNEKAKQSGNSTHSEPVHTRHSPFYPSFSRDTFTDMSKDRPISSSFIFALIRLSPVLAPILVVPALLTDPLAAEALLKLWLTLGTVLVAWNMTEGAAILWIKAKLEASEKTRSYLLVTMVCAMLTVAFLQYLRGLTSQGIFVITLGALSIRGISRSAWENKRPGAGFAAAIGGNTLITLISFLFFIPALDWQSVACACAIGISIAAVEASWYAHSFSSESWALPAFRLALCLGPVIITLMTISNQLPQPYLLTILVILLASRLIKKTRTTRTIPADFLRGAAGIYIAFLTIMIGCRAISSQFFDR